MKQFRYITDETANRRTPLNIVRLLANNQVPNDADVCFRISLRKDTDTKAMGGYSITHDTRRLEEMGLMLRIRDGEKWKTIALDPQDKRTLAEIKQDVANK